MASTHHTIDYVEFTVRDLAAAKRFYSTAFGWQFNDHGAEYAGIKGVDGEVGGMHQATQAGRAGHS
jgi:predicted enzyme related to lactoylglutathione lyase